MYLKKQEKYEKMTNRISTREIEVLYLVAHEKTTKEIANELFISAHTALSHRKNLMEKMQVKNLRLALVVENNYNFWDEKELPINDGIVGMIAIDDVMNSYQSRKLSFQGNSMMSPCGPSPRSPPSESAPRSRR